MQKKFIVAIFLLMCGILIPGSHTFANDDSRAVIITRGDYDDEFSNLSPGPENDGENFRRILCQEYGEAFAVTSLEKEGAETVAEVTEAIQTAFADSDSSDINYFYYSGHGGEPGMWLGGSEFMSAADLAQAFSGIQGTNFLVIDCCYSGNLISRSAGTESFPSRFITEFETAVKQRQFRSALTGSSFHVLVASAEGQESVQSGLGQHGEQMGFFTSAVSAGCGVNFSKISSKEDYLCTAMADKNRDGNVTFDELYQYVSGVLYASDAEVYPEQDGTVFLSVKDTQIPDTSVLGVQIGQDLDGKTYLEAEYQTGGDGILQGALYRCQEEEELWDALLMSVEPEVSDYPYAQLVQGGAWEFTADAGISRAELPFGAGSLEAGNYFLLINEKEGNTGCYVFPLTLESSVKSNLMENLTVQAKDSFSIEDEGRLEIRADFGISAYSNLYDCGVSCNIWNENGQLVRTYASQGIQTEFSEGFYQRFCVFQWDGKKSNGMQVTAGFYTIDICVSYGGSTQRKSRTVRVQSLAVSDKDSIEGMNILLSSTQFVYDGVAKCPEVSIAGLQNGKDFSVAYENNRNAGQGIVRVTGIGDYCGTVLKTFTILPMHISALEVKVQKQLVYTGKVRKASVKVYYNGSVWKEGTDYCLTYSQNKKPGYGKVTIQGIGNFTGKLKKRFKILPAAPKTQKASQKGTASWSLRWKRAAGADGYEIQYSVSKRFKKSVKRITLAGTKQKKLTVTVPQGNKRYYFRIRSYKKVGGKKWYSTYAAFS